MKSTLYICYKIMAILMVLPVSNGFEDNIYNMGDEDPVQEKIDPEMDEPDDSGIIADSDPSIDEPPLIAISTDGYFKGVNVTTVKGVAIKYNDDIFYPTEAQPSPPPMHIDSSEMRRKFKQKSRTVDNFKPYPQKDDISPEAEGTSTIVTELPCNATAIEEDYYRSIMEHVAFDKCLAQVPDLTENDIQDYRTLSIYSDTVVNRCLNNYEKPEYRVACIAKRLQRVREKFKRMRRSERQQPELLNACIDRLHDQTAYERTILNLGYCNKNKEFKIASRNNYTYDIGSTASEQSTYDQRYYIAPTEEVSNTTKIFTTEDDLSQTKIASEHSTNSTDDEHTNLEGQLRSAESNFSTYYDTDGSLNIIYSQKLLIFTTITIVKCL